MKAGRAALGTLVVLLVVGLGATYGYARVLVGSLVFFGLLSFGFKYWRDVGMIPPDPETEDVREYDLRYVCSMCGLELRVEVAARDKAPTHCMEPMELQSGSSSVVR